MSLASHLDTIAKFRASVMNEMREHRHNVTIGQLTSLVKAGRPELADLAESEARKIIETLALAGHLRCDGAYYTLAEQPAAEFLPFRVRLELGGSVPQLPTELRRRVEACTPGTRRARGERWIYIPHTNPTLIDDLVRQRLVRSGSKLDTVTMVIEGFGNPPYAWITVHNIGRDSPSPFRALLDSFRKAISRCRTENLWRAPVTIAEKQAVEADEKAAADFRYREKCAKACNLIDRMERLILTNTDNRRRLESEMATSGLGLLEALESVISAVEKTNGALARGEWTLAEVEDK